MKLFLRKIWRALSRPEKVRTLFRKATSTFRVSGWRGLWFAVRRYLRKQWFSIRETGAVDINMYIRQEIDAVLSVLLPIRDGMIFISHDASATGAPITLLNQSKAYKKVFGSNLVIVLISGGPLVEQFRAVAPVLDLHRHPTDIVIDENIEYAFSKLKLLGYSRCIANTVISGSLQRTLSANQIETIYEIHELLQLIETSGWTSYAHSIAQSGSIVVFPAHYVADKFMQRFGLPAERVRIIPQGTSLVYEHGKSLAREKLLNQLGLSNIPNVKIVLGAGFAHHRKGTDLFHQVAAEFHKKSILHVHFLWLGNRDEYFEHWKNQVLPQLPYQGNIHFLDFDPQPAYIFAGADVFLLTSREDPFPSVALEALANNTPVITFKDTGGIEEILDGTNGLVVEHLNVQKMAEATWEVLQNPDRMQPSKTNFQTYPEFIQTLIALFSNHKSDEITSS